MLEPEVTRAKQVGLARHENFAIRGRDGSLDYHTEEAKGAKNRFGDRALVLAAMNAW
jgi:hypothetical protein